MESYSPCAAAACDGARIAEQCVSGCCANYGRAVACSLHSVHDEEKPFEMELSWICPDSDNEFRRVPADLAAEAERAAKAALADSDMCVACNDCCRNVSCQWLCN